MIKKFSPSEDLSFATLDDINKSKRFFDIATVVGMNITQSFGEYDELIFDISNNATAISLVLRQNTTALTASYVYSVATATNTVSYLDSSGTSISVGSGSAKYIRLIVARKKGRFMATFGNGTCAGHCTLDADQVYFSGITSGHIVNITGVKYV